VELVAEHQVPDKGQGHFGIAVDDVGGGNVDERNSLLVADRLESGGHVAQLVDAQTAALSRHFSSGQNFENFEEDSAIAEIVIEVGDGGPAFSRSFQLRVDPFGEGLLLNVFLAAGDRGLQVFSLVCHDDEV